MNRTTLWPQAHRRPAWAGTLFCVAALVAALVAAGAGSAAPPAACSFCGKNLIQEPRRRGR